MQTKIKEIVKALKEANYIYIIGNGGSASLADHLACDLLKNCGLKAVSLCSNQALITAIANDKSFEDVFLNQVMILFQINDVLISLSTSGKSKNVLKAMEYVYRLKIGKVIGISGCDNGDVFRFCSTIFYHIDARDIQDCEDKMAQFCHHIYRELKRGSDE